MPFVTLLVVLNVFHHSCPQRSRELRRLDRGLVPGTQNVTSRTKYPTSRSRSYASRVSSQSRLMRFRFRAHPWKLHSICLCTLSAGLGLDFGILTRELICLAYLQSKYDEHRLAVRMRNRFVDRRNLFTNWNIFEETSCRRGCVKVFRLLYRCNGRI